VIAISVEDAARRLASAETALVDVRQDNEWTAGHVAAATHLPLAELEADPSVLARRVGDRPVAFLCRSGKRSRKAAELIARDGHRTVFNVEGGMKAWVDAGLSIEPRDGEIVAPS
jgi:rhodanese-related sulfurtransferase